MIRNMLTGVTLFFMCFVLFVFLRQCEQIFEVEGLLAILV